MSNRYYSEFSERKVKTPPKAPKGRAGTSAKPGPVSEKTAAWPAAGPEGPMAMNRKAKMDYVKQYVVKKGLC